MPTSLPARQSDRHRVIAEIQPEMAKADLRKAESEPLAEQIGGCLDDARRELGWTLDQLARALPAPAGAEIRDARQVQRWIDGKERCQVDVVFAVVALRAPFVEALARLSCEFEESRTFTRKVG